MSIRNCLVPRFLVPVLAVLGPLSISAHAAPQSRIRTAISDSDLALVRETVPGRARRAVDLGEASSDRTLSAVTLHFSLTDAQQADLTQLLADQQNPASPHYHQWLTPQQYGARFGLASADLTKVQTWLTSKGLKVVAVAPSQNYVTVSGSLPQVETAFNTRIHSFSENGELHVSNITDPQLPSAIAQIVTGITGLNDFRPTSRAIVQPRLTSQTTGNHFVAPGDFHKIYDVNPLLQQGIDGTGISIAIAGQTDINLSDVAAFRSAAGLPQKAPTVVQVPSLYLSGVRSNGDIGESSLDVEWSGAVAPNASILFVTVGANSNASVIDALVYAISNKVAPIVSISYGGCESASSQSSLNSLNQMFQQANAQGITVIGPSGDSGATDCDQAGLASEGLAVDFPASSPFVTGAGGTMFTGDISNPGQYWNSTNTSNGNGQYTSSVTGYIPESPWNETSTSSGLDAGGAAGGGASIFFAKPAWQTGLNVPNDGARDVPDISLAAGANHDGVLICSQNSCTNGFANSSGSFNVVGGTSVASPSFAGMLALLEQKLGTGGLGNINPTLYGLASVANVYHDISSGNNSVPCIQGTPNCSNGGSIGFQAGAGYDQATGLGTVDAANMVNNWTVAVPTGTGGIGAQCQSSSGQPVVCQTVTTLQATSSVVCGLTTTSLPFNVTVASGSSSTATPTGMVQLYVDNAPVGNPVALSNGSAQLILDTTKLPSGAHNVNAVYSGDSTFAGSRGALLTNTPNTGIVTQIDVVSTTSPDFSMTPCLGSASVASGSSASPVTLTITPTAGFSGTVNLSANSDSGDLLGYAFSVKPVTVSTSAGVTTQFVLTATVPVSSSSVRKLSSPFNRRSSGGSGWYVTGSSAVFACFVLIAVPRRRWRGTLFALVLSVAAFGAIGCGGGSSSSSGSSGSGSNGGGATTQPAARGTYNITVTATSSSGGTTRVHSVVLTYSVL